jgi:hypothetical protein
MKFKYYLYPGRFTWGPGQPVRFFPDAVFYPAG